MAKCTSCHGLGTFTGQRRSGQQWSATVKGMVPMGMPATPQEIAQLTNYLTAQLGRPVNANQATAAGLEADLLLSPQDAESIVRYREQNGPFKLLSDIEKVPAINVAQIRLQQANITF
jgi:competence ComEA-like helix-hairpin-helix protein